MADKLTPQQIKAIIASQKPGFEAETGTSDDQQDAAAGDFSHVQSGAPDLDYLAAKFLKGGTSGGGPAATRHDASTTTKASKIVRVHPAGTEATDAVGTGNRKVVVVSAKEEKIVGEQG